jgi:hypothetical protein
MLKAQLHPQNKPVCKRTRPPTNHAMLSVPCTMMWAMAAYRSRSQTTSKGSCLHHLLCAMPH